MSRARVLDQSARRLAEALYDAEDGVEEAMARVGAMMVAVGPARRAARLAASCGLDIYGRLARSAVALAGVQEEIVGVHDRLAELKAESLARTVDIGFPDKPEDDAPREPIGLHVMAGGRSA